MTEETPPAAPPAAQPAEPVAAPPTAVEPVAPPEPELCKNCAAALTGTYCSACGQRGMLRSLSLRELSAEALHDVAHFDSRLWRTMIALLFRPGRLTNEFIAGRRTYYLPPIRLYLVLSLLFFLLVSCNPSAQPVVAGSQSEANAPVLADLTLSSDSPTATGLDCATLKTDVPGRAWLEPRARTVCEHLKGVSARQFSRALIANLPKMMFVFLPLMALVNWVLYLFSRRQYAEHLLFYLHFHAFVFLLLSLRFLTGSLLGWVKVLSFLGTLTTIAVVLYLFIWLYKGMRHVYRQPRLLTLTKYFLVLFAYAICLLLTTLVALTYTAMTV